MDFGYIQHITTPINSRLEYKYSKIVSPLAIQRKNQHLLCECFSDSEIDKICRSKIEKLLKMGADPNLEGYICKNDRMHFTTPMKCILELYISVATTSNEASPIRRNDLK
jgi:hypothetical protein